MSRVGQLVVSALCQFIITGGTALLAVASANGSISLRSCMLATAGGLIAVAKDVRTYLAEPPL